MERRDGKPELLRLWPTLMLRHCLPGAEAANALLLERILALEAKNTQLTIDYLATSFLEDKHPAIAWLRDCVNRSVVDYIKETGIDYDLDWSLQAWPNVNRFGDYHNLHNHPHAWLSGTYYLQVPEQAKALPGRNDRNPGAISFFDPRP